MKKEQKIWDKMASSFHLTSSKSRAHKDKYLKISRIILESKPNNILELGCGSGILEKELFDNGYKGNVLAIDASEPMLTIARTLVVDDKYKFIRRDVESGFGTDEKFDLIASINLFFFLDDKQKFLINVSNHLKNKESVFIMVNPKPKNQTNNWDFVRDHFRDTTKQEKILIFLNELTNIPRYLSMAISQRKLDSLSKKGAIVHDCIDDIKIMAKKANLDIIKTEDIHAKQNWMFIMRRVD